MQVARLQLPDLPLRWIILYFSLPFIRLFFRLNVSYQFPFLNPSLDLCSIEINFNKRRDFKIAADELFFAGYRADQSVLMVNVNEVSRVGGFHDSVQADPHENIDFQTGIDLLNVSILLILLKFGDKIDKGDPVLLYINFPPQKRVQVETGSILGQRRQDDALGMQVRNILLLVSRLRPCDVVDAQDVDLCRMGFQV